MAFRDEKLNMNMNMYTKICAHKCGFCIVKLTSNGERTKKKSLRTVTKMLETSSEFRENTQRIQRPSITASQAREKNLQHKIKHRQMHCNRHKFTDYS